jgi:hypothetical protein
MLIFCHKKHENDLMLSTLTAGKNVSSKKGCGLKPTAFIKKTMDFIFFRLPMVFYKFVVFYLAGPWIDFLKKKPSKKLKKPK